MNTNKIYKGNLIVNYSHTIPTILLKVKKGYITLESINSFLDIYRINHKMIHIPVYKTDICKLCYVDESSLELYDFDKKHMSLKKIKNITKMEQYD